MIGDWISAIAGEWGLILGVLIAIAVFLLVRAFVSRNKESAEEIVRRRFAAGEISIEEFRERTTRLGHKRDH